MSPAGFVVEVIDPVSTGPEPGAGSIYSSAVMLEADARAIARIVLGGPIDLAGAGPWRRAIAGARCTIRLRLAGNAQPAMESRRELVG